MDRQVIETCGPGFVRTKCMRCPECLTRNSVAAKKCDSCGQKLPSKGPSKAILGASGGVVVLLALAIGLFLTIPKFADPEQNLSRIAKQVADGPATPQAAQSLKKEFEDAIKKYLEKKGSGSSSSLAGNLQGLLPNSAFEVHVIDLPRALKLVEIDTVLHASAFLVMKGTNDTKVFALPGVEVFDDARIISDEAGPVLVILAHSGGQPPHRPQVRTFAILPDSIIDESEKAVPAVIGEGHGKFAGNDRDLYFELTVPSVASADNIDLSSLKPNSEQIIKQYLVWKDAKYHARYEYSNDPLSLSVSFARLLSHADYLASSQAQLGPQAASIARDYAGRLSGPYAISSAGNKNGVSRFIVSTGDRQFMLSFKPQAGKWAVVNVETAARTGEQTAHFDAVKSNVNSGESSGVSKTPDTDQPVKPDLVAALATATTTAPAQNPNKQERDLKNPNLKNSGSQKPGSVSATTPAEITAKESKPATIKDTANSAPVKATIASYLSASSVRMRAGPNTDRKTVTEIPKGESVDILGQKDGWYKVRYRGQDGYVYGGFVDTKKADAYTTAVVTRSMPVTDKSSKPLFTPQAGDRLIILSGINNNRYKVRLSDGRIGYVDKHALDVNVEAPELVP